MIINHFIILHFFIAVGIPNITDWHCTYNYVHDYNWWSSWPWSFICMYSTAPHWLPLNGMAAVFCFPQYFTGKPLSEKTLYNNQQCNSVSILCTLVTLTALIWMLSSVYLQYAVNISTILTYHVTVFLYCVHLSH